MLFYSSLVLRVICHHPEMLQITTAPAKQGRLVSQGREDWIAQALGSADANRISAQTSFLLLTGRVKRFAQDELPLLVLHLLWRLDALLSGREVASLGHVKHHREAPKDGAQAVCMNCKVVTNWNKSLWALSSKRSWQLGERACFLDDIGTSPKLVPLYPCQFRPTWWDRKTHLSALLQWIYTLFFCVLPPSLPKFLSKQLFPHSPFETGIPEAILIQLGLYGLGGLDCMKFLWALSKMVWSSSAGTTWCQCQAGTPVLGRVPWAKGMWNLSAVGGHVLT